MKKGLKILAALFSLLMTVLLCLPSYALLPDYPMSSSYMSGSYYENLIAVKLTGDMRKDLVNVAKSQIGYHEGSSKNRMDGTSSSSDNYTEYNNFYCWYATKYYKDTYNYINCAWCGSFVSFCLYMAKIPSSVVRLTAQAKPNAFGLKGSSALSGSKFISFKDTVIKGGSYTPLPGDIVFYAYSEGSDSFRHVAIVESTEYSYDSSGKKIMTLNTIEGNCSDRVKNYHWTFDSSSSGRVYSSMYVSGFGVPKYSTSIIEDEDNGYDIGSYGGSLLQSGSSGSAVIKLQAALNLVDARSSSYSCSCAVSGSFDSATTEAVKAYQKTAGLECDGIVGSQTWSDLRSRVKKLVGDASTDYIMKNGTLLLYKGTSSSVTLPDSCKAIGGCAFTGTSVKSLTLPTGFESVLSYAFYNVSTLKTVVHKDSRAVSANVSVSSTGNSAYLNAGHTYTTPTYTITYKLLAELTVAEECEENALPSYTPENILIGSTLYNFVGWDKPIAPATENTTYTACYHETSTFPIALHSDGVTVDDDGSVHVDIIARCTSEVTSFSFTVDYSSYADHLTLTNSSSKIDGVCIENPVEGILRVTRDGGNVLKSTQVLLSLDFSLAEYVTQEQMYLSLSCVNENGDCFSYRSDASYFVLETNCDGCVIDVDRTEVYDFDMSGSLDISDVSALLNFLSSADAADSGYTIGFVTKILDALAYIA